MQVTFDTIYGVALGIEFIPATDEFENTIIIDLLLGRILVQWN